MSSPSTTRPAIRATGIVKRFGGALALDGVGVEVAPGECHAIVGENGAGKSTLMRILAGVITPDAGTVEVNGTPLTGGAKAALDAGIALVHQELSLVPEMTVAENIVLGSTPTRGGFIRGKAVREQAAAALQEIGVDVPLDENVGRLSVAARQFVEIARAVARRPDVLILDEPTATLTPAETDQLLTLLKRLAAQGIAILYISHRLPEIFALCQRATILRDGKLIRTAEIADITPDDMVNAIVGRELERDLGAEHATREGGEPVLTARAVSAPRVADVSLQVRAGEIVGIGGLVGAGRTELIRALLGVDPRTAGEVILRVDGRDVPLRGYGTAIKHGVCYVPEERRTDGLAITMSVSDNIALPNRGRVSRFGILSRSRTSQLVNRIVGEVGLRPAQPQREVGLFSGGNQQKVVIGKWLAAPSPLVVIDEPTRGVDVGAKAEIHRLLRRLADEGSAILMVSSDLPELLDLSDRVLVVRDGRIVGELPRGEADERSVMRLAAGGTEAAA
jgi:ABC-type sugar transport system ATPase subunit